MGVDGGGLACPIDYMYREMRYPSVHVFFDLLHSITRVYCQTERFDHLDLLTNDLRAASISQLFRFVHSCELATG